MSEEIIKKKEDTVAMKTSMKKDELLEMLVAIMLGVTAVFTAWATWVGSLHGGNQATNYTTSNNIAADGNSRWNEASQTLMQDMLLWNDISDLELDINYADSIGDDEAMELAAYKLYYKCFDNLSENMADAIGFDFDEADASDPVDYVLKWIDTDKANVSPFTDGEFVESYYAEAAEVLDEAQAYLELGQQDNKNGDRFNLVTVIYSVVLFLLGIIGIFKKIPNRFVVFYISCAAFLGATIFMFTIPLPF